MEIKGIPSELKAIGKQFFSGEREAFATTLLSILVKAYGIGCLNWDGITIQMQVKDDFDTDISRKVYDQLMGLISVLTTDSVYKDVEVFDEIVSALVGHGIGVEQNIPSVDDVAWVVAEIGLNDPDPVTRNPEDPWKSDIKKYIRVVLDNEGMKTAPKILNFVPSVHMEKEGMDDPSYYAGIWKSQQARADEVDTWVSGQLSKLVDQLGEIGINVVPS